MVTTTDSEVELRVIAGLEDGFECWSKLTTSDKPQREEGEGIWEWRARINVLAKEMCIKRIAKKLK